MQKKKPSTMLDELRVRVVGFIQMEKMTAFNEQMHGESSKKQSERKEKTENGQDQGRSKSDRPPPRPR